MVDVEEIDDEGKPLRYDESFYHQPKPTLEDRVRRLGQREEKRKNEIKGGTLVKLMLINFFMSAYLFPLIFPFP